jgi:hypothetical protein
MPLKLDGFEKSDFILILMAFTSSGSSDLDAMATLNPLLANFWTRLLLTLSPQLLGAGLSGETFRNVINKSDWKWRQGWLAYWEASFLQKVTAIGQENIGGCWVDYCERIWSDSFTGKNYIVIPLSMIQHRLMWIKEIVIQAGFITKPFGNKDT